MNVLDIIPGISEILDKTVTKKSDLEQIKLQLRELDIRELEARLGVQRSWLDNKSVFVAGAIPMMLWMVSVVVLFNHIIAPLLSPLVGPLPTLDLPTWYSSLAGTIIIGLFGKKAWDGNTIQLGTFSKPAKGGDAVIAQTAPAADRYDDPQEVDARIDELAHRYGAKR